MRPSPWPFAPAVDDLIRRALEEDIGSGDLTSELCISGDDESVADLRAKQNLVVAGLPVAERAFHMVDASVRFDSSVADGTRVSSGTVLATVTGRTRSLLLAERVALNFLQRLSGIASLCRSYVDAVTGTKTRIVDTRKTTPGLRLLEKYAVRTGGAMNHRTGLFDGILVKDNHIARNPSITETVRRIRQQAPHLLKIEVEVSSQEQLEEALMAGADVIMLDNMSVEAMQQAVRTVAGRVPLEASGNVSLSNVRAIAETGVDLISAGALTHSAPAADISLLIR